MILLAKGTQLDGATPLLDFWAAVDGKLVDLYSLTFQIWEIKDLEEAQVYPVSGSQAVNVSVTYPTAGAGRLAKGHYFATWAMSASQAPGRYEVRWAYRFTSTGLTFTARVPFEVVGFSSVPEPRLLSGILDLRDEGVAPNVYDDRRAYRALLNATRYIERVTGRWFGARAATLTLDGRGTGMLGIPLPIVAIGSVKVTSGGDFASAQETDASAYRVYARHLDESMRGGVDDRQNPKIEIVDSIEGDLWRSPTPYFPRGSRNVQVVGAFGYTDPDGTPFGRTPEQIEYACRKLALRYLPALNSSSAGGVGAAPAGPIKRERTKDQEIEYASGGVNSVPGGAFTGDAEIDGILESYRRPPQMGGV